MTTVLGRTARLGVRLAGLGLVVLALGCGGAQPGSEESAAGPLRYPLSGQVVAVDAEKAALRVAHDRIPGYMDAMTMRFPVPDRESMAEVKERDHITATLVVAVDNRYWLEDLKIVAPPPHAPAGDTPVPAEHQHEH
jgi:protein SCO1/2